MQLIFDTTAGGPCGPGVRSIPRPANGRRAIRRRGAPAARPSDPGSAGSARRRAQLRPGQTPQVAARAARRARHRPDAAFRRRSSRRRRRRRRPRSGSSPSQISTPAKARPSASRRADSRSRTSSERCGYHGVAGRSPPRSQGAVIDTNSRSVASTQSSRPNSSNRHHVGNRGVLERSKSLRAILSPCPRARRIVVEQRASQQRGLRRCRRLGSGRPGQRLGMIDVPPQQLTGRRRRVREAGEHPGLRPDRQRDFEVAGVVDQLTQMRAAPRACAEQRGQPRPSTGVTREPRLDQRVQRAFAGSRRHRDRSRPITLSAGPRIIRPTAPRRFHQVVACSRLDVAFTSEATVGPMRRRRRRARRAARHRRVGGRVGIGRPFAPSHDRDARDRPPGRAPAGAAGPHRHGQRRGRAQAAG